MSTHQNPAVTHLLSLFGMTEIPKHKRVDVVELTREITDALLAINILNRPVRCKSVDEYAAAMAGGSFFYTNIGIGIDTDCFLVDAQHRLFGHRKAGYPKGAVVPILWGIDPRARAVIDRGGIRHMADIMALSLKVEGFETPAVGRSLSAALRLCYLFQNNQVFNEKPALWPFIEYTQDTYAVWCDWRPYERSIPAPFLAVLILASRSHKREAFEFAEKLTSLVGLEAGSPVLALRKLWTSNAGGGFAGQTERFRKAVAAFDAFLKGRTAEKLYGTTDVKWLKRKS